MTKKTPYVSHHEAAKESAAAEEAESKLGQTPDLAGVVGGVVHGQTATVGRIVIYSHPGGPDGTDNPRECAAVVTGVDDDGAVSLFVMHPDGAVSSAHHVKHGTAFGTWHWPPLV